MAQPAKSETRRAQDKLNAERGAANDPYHHGASARGAANDPHHRGARPEGFMRIRAVQEATGLGRSTIYRLIAKGRFPKPMHVLGDRVSVWRSSEIIAWQESVIEAA